MRLLKTSLVLLLLAFPGRPVWATPESAPPESQQPASPRAMERAKAAALAWVRSIGWDKKVNCAASLFAAATAYSYSSTTLNLLTTLDDRSIAGFGVAGATSGFLLSWKAVRKIWAGQNPLARAERVDGAGILAGSFVGAWLAYSIVDASAGAWAPMIGGIAGLGAGWRAAAPLDRRLQAYFSETPALDDCIARIFPDPKQASEVSPSAQEIPPAFRFALEKLAGKQVPFWVVRTPGAPDKGAEYHLLVAEKLHGVRMILLFSDTLRPPASLSPDDDAVVWRPLADVGKI